MTLLFEASRVEMFIGGRRLFTADPLRIAAGERARTWICCGRNGR